MRSRLRPIRAKKRESRDTSATNFARVRKKKQRRKKGGGERNETSRVEIKGLSKLAKVCTLGRVKFRMTSANKSSAGPTRINTRRMVAAMFSNGGVRTELTRHALSFFSFFFLPPLETQIVGEGRMRRDINDSLCRNLADQTRPSPHPPLAQFPA